MSPSEFREMWARDLARVGLKQQDVAAKLRARGAPITASAVSQWVAQGYPPRGRMKMLADVFGPDSEFAKVPPETWTAMWGAGAKVAKAARAAATTPRADALTYSETSAAPLPRQGGEVMRYVPLLERIREAMPVELQGCFRPDMPLRPRRHIPAYQHDGLTVEFVVLRGGPMFRLAASAALFRLAVMKKTYHARNSQHQYMLLLVEDDQPASASTSAYAPKLSESERTKVIGDLRDDAYTMGLGLGLATSAKLAANYLESRAFDMVSGDPEDFDAAEMAADEDFLNQN